MAISDGGVGTRQCPACRSVVPDAGFCGVCGARLDGPVGNWAILLRPRVYANAHQEPIWTPRVSSALFPRVPGKPRKPFRLALILVLIAIPVLAAARIPGPLGVLSILGWPLIFLIYSWRSEVFRDIPLRILMATGVLGAGLGVSWWLFTGTMVANRYGVSTGESLLLIPVLNVGLLLSLGGAVLMLVPALVTRLFPVPVREALDGFVVGAGGALWYSTAATTTILGPQFAEGLMEEQSAGRLLEDSLTYGIVNSICATAAGGLIGLSLWFQPDRRPGRDPRRARTALSICTALGVLTYPGLWIVDSLELPRAADALVKLTLAVLALLAVRCGIQIALLHETPDPATGDPILCVHCERVVPDMAFCAACGTAARASSRSSRRLRHQYPPVRQPAPG